MNYLYYKAFHIIGFVSWFACLFYLVRLFIYHTEAFQKENPDKKILHDQFLIMEKRLLFVIGYPAMLVTLVFGFLMFFNWDLKVSIWLHIKLIFVFVLMGYHFFCHHIMAKFKNQTCKYSSFQLRLMNETATLLLISIVLLAVLKNTTLSLYGVIGFLILGVLLYSGVYFYRGKK